MARAGGTAKTIFTCGECGASAAKWQGQCPGCGLWNTLVETVAEAPAVGSQRRFAALAGAAGLQTLSDIEAREEDRLPTGIGEFDRALGGGLVRGGVVLLGGDPGIGKSTLLLQALAILSSTHEVLYVSGEESGQQIALRARRLSLVTGGLKLLAEINLERILATLQSVQPRVAVIDLHDHARRPVARQPARPHVPAAEFDAITGGKLGHWLWVIGYWRLDVNDQ